MMLYIVYHLVSAQWCDIIGAAESREQAERIRREYVRRRGVYYDNAVLVAAVPAAVVEALRCFKGEWPPRTGDIKQ